MVNPPGMVKKDGKIVEPSLIKPFWEKLHDEIRADRVLAGIWIGYSLEQLQTLQNTAPGLDLDMICVPSRRPQHLDFDGEALGSPTHGSFVALILNYNLDEYDLDQHRDRFRSAFYAIGKVL